MHSTTTELSRTFPLILFLAGLCSTLYAPGAGAESQTVLRESRSPEGSLKARWEVHIDEKGRDIRHGRLWHFHANGQTALLGWYRDGKAVGRWTWWDEQGFPLRSIRYEYGLPTLEQGAALEHPESTYRRLDGRLTAIGQLKGDQPHGHWEFYYADGASRAIGEYHTGIPHGRWTFYYPNGQLKQEAHYETGVLHGAFREGYKNGQEQRVGQMDQGLKHGPWHYWHHNGALRAEGEYVSDLQNGEWRYWDAQGRLLRRATYRAGNLIEMLEIPDD